MKRWAALGLSLLFLALSPVREVRPAAGTEAVDTTKYIALTFDDGPRPDTTGRLLEELARRGVHATFFLIGRQIPGNEDLIRQMALFGHQIGVHTYDHVLLEGEDEYTVRQQVRQTERLLDQILETEGDWWLRPPYGAMTQREAAWVETPMIQWTIDPEDWRDEDAQRVTEHILERAGPGEVILLHDIFPATVDAALAVVDALQSRGYVFVTVRELFQAQGVDPRPGMLYMSPKRPMWPL